MTFTSEERLPRNHRLVLDVVRTHEQHLAVADVYADTRSRSPKIGYTTVYRALQRLVQEGFVRSFPSNDGKHTIYDRKAREHGHISCDACGTLIDIEIDVPEQLWRPFAQRWRGSPSSSARSPQGISGAAAPANRPMSRAS